MVDSRLGAARAFGLFVLPLLALLVPGCKRAQSNAIRAVDFRNFTYVAPTCLEEEGTNITTKDGKFERPVAPLSVEFFEVRDIVYGDLTGDGQDEAAVVTGCSGGGSGVFDEVVVFTMRSGTPQVLTRVEGGDRAAGGVHRVSLREKTIEVGRYGEAGSGLCCPDYVEWTTYRWEANKLLESGGPRRTVVPGEVPAQATPVQFDNGATSAVVSGGQGTIAYAVAVRAGQTLRLEVQSGDPGSVRVSVADGTYLGTLSGVDEGLWEGRLPQSGEYRVTVLRSGGAYRLRVSLE